MFFLNLKKQDRGRAEFGPPDPVGKFSNTLLHSRNDTVAGSWEALLKVTKVEDIDEEDDIDGDAEANEKMEKFSTRISVRRGR